MNEEDYVFPKEIRESMEKYVEKENVNFSADPDFYHTIFNAVGLSKEEQCEMWNKIGRPDLAEDLIDE